jgi:GTPase SAR1 family protein
MKIAITGAPRAGKTSLANKISGEVVHTDALKHLAWSDQSAAVAAMLTGGQPGDVIEGTTVARGLRKWLAANPVGKPVDILYYLPTAREALTAGQTSMAHGVDTVLREIAGELMDRGVQLVSVAGNDAATTTRRLERVDFL